MAANRRSVRQSRCSAGGLVTVLLFCRRLPWRSKWGRGKKDCWPPVHSPHPTSVSLQVLGIPPATFYPTAACALP